MIAIHIFRYKYLTLAKNLCVCVCLCFRLTSQSVWYVWWQLIGASHFWLLIRQELSLYSLRRLILLLPLHLHSHEDNNNDDDDDIISSKGSRKKKHTSVINITAPPSRERNGLTIRYMTRKNLIQFWFRLISSRLVIIIIAISMMRLNAPQFAFPHQTFS